MSKLFGIKCNRQKRKKVSFELSSAGSDCVCGCRNVVHIRNTYVYSVT